MDFKPPAEIVVVKKNVPPSNADFNKKSDSPTNVDFEPPAEMVRVKKKFLLQMRILTKKVAPTNGDFERKFQKIETKSDFFPIGKIGIQFFPKIFFFLYLNFI